MESGAKGCEVVVSGKLRAARAKSMKFTDGFMIHSGQPARDFVDYAVRHVLLKQGVLGIKVKMCVDLLCLLLLGCLIPWSFQYERFRSRGSDWTTETLTGYRYYYRTPHRQNCIRTVVRVAWRTGGSHCAPGASSCGRLCVPNRLPAGAVPRDGVLRYIFSYGIPLVM